MPEDPNLTARGSNLELRNATQDYEGIYYCQTEYENGHHSAPEGVGCVFVLGENFIEAGPISYFVQLLGYREACA